MGENAKQEYWMTKEQQIYLNSLTCYRLDKEKDKDFVDRLVNLQNTNLAKALKNGWNADKKDKLAYYIVKDPKLDVPMFFFSLRCGEMHKPLDREKLNNTVLNSLMLLKEASRVCSRIVLMPASDILEQIRIRKHSLTALEIAQDVEVADWAKEAIEKQLVNGELTDKAWCKIWKRVFRTMGNQGLYEGDEKMEGQNIVRTKNNFPAVELVHFCAYDPINWKRYGPNLTKEEKKKIKLDNDKVAQRWHEMGMDSRSMGETFFWKFVVNTIQELRKLVGCEYIYLFAADENDDRDGSLIRYYKRLGFNFRDDINVTKPAYDFCCYFMCQEVTALRNRKNDFLRNYNKPKG